MKKYDFTAYIEQDAESGLYVGYVPGVQGAHTQAETLDELHRNLIEVLELCIEELPRSEIRHITNNYIGTQRLSIAV